MVRGLLAAACSVGAAFALGGCGTEDDERKAAAVVGRFMSAVEQEDGRAACAQLGEDVVDELESSEGERCSKAILSQELSGSPVSEVETWQNSAKVDLAEGESVFLDQGPRGWKVSAAGCTPREDQPYDCEVQS